jgi:hypothetical protein
MRPTGAGGLEREAFPATNQFVDAFDQEPPGRKRASFRIEGRQSARNLVGIHKFSDAQPLWD